ncbi:MAG: CapA family protein [Bacteroidota bacterium]
MKKLLFFALTFVFMQSQAQHKDTLLITGVGDIMLGTMIPSNLYLPPNNDCSNELSKVKQILMEADVAFCNLEGVLTDSKAGQKKCSKCYTFGMPTKYAQCLVDVGFDLISTANNHASDFGAVGRQSTVKTLEKAGLHYAGFLSTPYTIFEKDSIKYGFCAFSPEGGNCSINNIPEAQRIVRKLDSLCDVVIVSFHSGCEGKAFQHVPCTNEICFGYNRGNVCDFSHKVIDAGADIVFGHGPHVTRAVELYKDRFIAYSMGNFCTYSSISISGVNGLAPMFKIYTDRKGAFLKGEIVATYQIKPQPVLIDEQKRVIKVIQDLTKADFPSSPLIISNDGLMTKKK